MNYQFPKVIQASLLTAAFCLTIPNVTYAELADYKKTGKIVARL